MIKKIITYLLINCLAIFFISCSPQDEFPKKIPNPSFEQVKGDQPETWYKYNWQGKAEFKITDLSKAGNRSAAISSTDGADVSWSTIISVKPFSKYKFSGWIKTEDLIPSNGKGALFNLHGIRGAETTIVRIKC